ncbi:MAG: outer membrane beta-barrel protein [Alphaproteobacteria bacterium]|nr:outer membrane beta-barrel protein [Alphaproteobacteria bacterium]
MKEKSVFLLVAFSCFIFNNSYAQNNDRYSIKNDASDFQKFEEPDQKISGAYYGLGLGLSNISNQLHVYKNDGTSLNHKKSANQYDISLIGGFGTVLYNKYYAGVEFDFFKRLPKKTTWFDKVGIVHKANMGLNMDVRFGCQFPKQGNLLYVTVGFARVLGEMQADNNGTINKATFGSFFPTAGIGIEHRMNQKVNIRGDFRYTFGSKERKSMPFNGNTAEFQGKPKRFAFRLSVVRSI